MAIDCMPKVLLLQRGHIGKVLMFRQDDAPMKSKINMLLLGWALASELLIFLVPQLTHY
jgi:hypothetical protein